MLTGLVVFLLVVLTLLALPVTLSYQVSWRQTFRGSMTLRWLFGLVRIKLPITAAQTTATEDKPTRSIASKRMQASKRSNPVAAFRQKAFRQRIFRFVGDLWHAVRKQHLKLRIRIGLGDPADTGLLWAMVGPVSAMLSTVKDASIDIEPEFIDTVFELDSSGNIRVIPLQIIYLALGLLLSPAFWQGMNRMRRSTK